MKYSIFICSFFILLLFQNCTKNRRIIDFEAGLTISVSYNEDMYAPLDSFVSEIKIIPLETNDNCLIGQPLMERVKYHQGLIYISFMRKLLVFDLAGKFIREIGSMGEGPGEYIEVRDFLFTDEGTIELLDFLKIESYTLDGKHIGSKKFNFMGPDYYCNPRNFCLSFSSGYYLWGGIVQDEKLRKQSNLMYRVNHKMDIVEGYFSQEYGDGGGQDRFKYYQDKILFTPSGFDYNIYQIDSDDDVKIRYSFDFGKYGFDSNKNIDRQYISYENFIHDIYNYHETDRFLYFGFSHQKFYHSLLFSKITGQSYTLTQMQSFKRKEFCLFPIVTMYDDYLIAMIDVYAIKEYLNGISRENIEKWGLEELENLDNEDNPVLIFYKIKL